MMAETVGSDPQAASGDASAAQQRLLVRVFAGVLMAGFVMAFSLAISSGYGFGALARLEHDVGTAHYVLLVAALPALLLLGGPVVRAAARDLRERHLTLNVLFTLGTASAVAVSAITYVRGSGPIYLETAVMLLALYTLGRYLTARAKGTATRVLGRLLDVPDAAVTRLAPDPGDVTPDALREGDVVRIPAGGVMPVDGRVREGSSYVDESRLTGEARPARRATGDAVYAGTSVLDGALVVEATAVADDRRLARVEATMRRVLREPPRLASLTDRILRGLIPGVLVLAIGTFAAWWAVAGVTKAVYVALSVILITCPCALGIAIPLALVVSLGEAARKGLVVRSGQTLLDLAAVDRVLFDKTGTLSALATPSVRVVVPDDCLSDARVHDDRVHDDRVQDDRVQDVRAQDVRAHDVREPDPVTHPPSDGASDAASDVGAGQGARSVTAGGVAPSSVDADRLLAWAAAVERGTQHVLGAALVEAASARGLTLPPARDLRTEPGAGVVGTVQPEGAAPVRVGVGSATLVEALDAACLPSLTRRGDDARAAGQTVLHVVVGDRVAGLVLLAEHARPDAHDAVAALRADGVSLGMLTGDRPAAAHRLATALGLDLDADADAGLGPDAKLARIRVLRDTSDAVALVGDGINDAAALAAADVGIALRTGAPVAMEAAGVTLYNPDLTLVPWLHRQARRTRRVIRQNLAWTFGYNAVGLGLAVAGWLHPIAAVVIMTLSSLLVTANAFRLKRSPDAPHRR